MELLKLPISAPSTATVVGPTGNVYPVMGRLVAVLDSEVADFLRRDFTFPDPEERNQQ